MAERARRRLAAIVLADVAGYSRLIGADEEGTLQKLRTYRLELINPLIAEHGGRIANTAGDSMLLEFPSAVDAVRCSLAVQREMATRNVDVDPDKRICFRVGINVGDVVAEGEDLLGDGVNIAARVEGLASPGGLAISDDAYRQVRDRLDVAWQDGGEHEVKNIARPVRVWRWSEGTAQVAPAARATAEPLPLPDKPSIAVLPFDNMSGDAEQEYFVDGLTEDIITELSRFQSLIVIARHSVFVYKGKPVTVQDVGRELSVHYVVEGSVRTAGGRLRVTVQLIEAQSDSHVWAERYDHDLKDIFELQDEITQAIVAAIPGRLESADLSRIKRKRPEDMAVYDYVLRGKMHHHRITKDDNAEALRLLDKAIEMDPEFAEAYAWKACTLGQALARGFGDDKADLFARDVEACERALSLDENNFECHWIMCEVRMMVGRLEDAELHHQKAFDLNSNDPRVVAQRSELLTWLGRPLEGVDWARQAMRLDPYNAAGRAHLLGRALYLSGNYMEAIEAFRQIRAPSFKHHAEIAACHALFGSDEKARQHAAEVLRLQPNFTIAGHMESLPFKEASDRETYREGLIKAGLPE
jgi:adenylate cyclase